MTLSLPFPSGLSPDLQSMEQIRRIMRPTDVPDQGLLCDLLWADPDKETVGWGENDRGVSFTFGPEIVTKYLHKHDMDLICRAHQVRLTSNDDMLDQGLPCALLLYLSGCGRWIRVLCQASVSHSLFCSKLLWRV